MLLISVRDLDFQEDGCAQGQIRSRLARGTQAGGNFGIGVVLHCRTSGLKDLEQLVLHFLQSFGQFLLECSTKLLTAASFPRVVL